MKLFLFCIAVAMRDILVMYEIETVFHFRQLLTASEFFFFKCEYQM